MGTIRLYVISTCLFIMSASGLAKESFYSGFDISEQCEKAYEYSLEVYQESISAHHADPSEFYSQKLKTVDEDCELAFSLGLFDARSYMQQQLSLEYIFERELLSKNRSLRNAKLLEQINQIYSLRFKLAHIPTELLSTLSRDTNTIKELYQQAFQSVKSNATKIHKFIPIGRFVVTPGRSQHLHTLYDYEIIDGVIQLDKNDQPLLKDGSFVYAATRTWKSALAVAEEYMAWMPSMWFGEDSWVYGGFWRWLRNDPDEKSIREIIEEGYFNRMTMYFNAARDLGLPLKAFANLQLAMAKKQSAVIERDIKIMKGVRIGAIAAPFIPLGMAIGGVGLTYVGFKAIPAGTASFSLISGSLAYSANIAAASSLATMGFFFGKGLFQGIKSVDLFKGFKKNVSSVADAAFLSTVMAFPLTALVPIVVGGVPAAGKYIFLNVVQFMAHIKYGFQFMKVNGLKGTLAQIPKIPGFVFKAWLNAWWTKGAGFNKKLIALYLAGNTVSIASEIIDREFIIDDPDDRFFTKDGINKKSLYRLVPTAVLGIVATPIIKCENLIERYTLWRLMDLVGTVGVTLAFTGEVDNQYLKFHMAYGATGGASVGELGRVVTMAIMNSGMSSKKGFFLHALFQLSVIFPVTRMRNYFLEKYYDDDLPVPSEVKDMMKEEMNVDVEAISDEQIEEIFRELYNSETYEELMQLLKNDRTLDTKS